MIAAFDHAGGRYEGPARVVGAGPSSGLIVRPDGWTRDIWIAEGEADDA